MRVELQLEVSGSVDQRCASGSQPLKRFDARRVGGHEVRQIDLNGEDFRADSEQFRNLRDAQPAGQPYKASIDLLNDADPAIHAAVRGKTQATTDRPRDAGKLHFCHTFVSAPPGARARPPTTHGSL